MTNATTMVDPLATAGDPAPLALTSAPELVLQAQPAALGPGSEAGTEPEHRPAPGPGPE